MLKTKLALSVAALGLALAACGGGDGGAGDGGGDSAPTPKELWIKEVKDAGFLVKPGLTYGNMFERAQAFCDLPNKGKLILLTSLAMEDSESFKNMKKKGIDSDVAVQKYADATWEHACGKE